jgi:hypothetical protein
MMPYAHGFQEELMNRVGVRTSWQISTTMRR